MEDRELARCPYCGSSSINVQTLGDDQHKRYATICTACGASGPIVASARFAIARHNKVSQAVDHLYEEKVKHATTEAS